MKYDTSILSDRFGKGLHDNEFALEKLVKVSEVKSAYGPNGPSGRSLSPLSVV